jgi:transposase
MLTLQSPRPGRRPNPALATLWQQRLRHFEQSGLSATAFCTEHGLSLPSFFAWRRRLRQQAMAAATDGVSPDTRFVPIRLLPGAPPLELVLPTGAILRLAPGCDLAFVRALVVALGDTTSC